MFESIKDLGPLITLLSSVLTLLSIVLTNWQSSRNYRISQGTSKAHLFARDIWFIADDSQHNPFARIGVEIDNAGQRPAHVIRNRMEIHVLPIATQVIDIADSRTDPSDEVVPREQPLYFTSDTVPLAVDPTIRTAKDLYQSLQSRGQQLFFVMKTQYSDDIDTYWMNYCKRLGEAGTWKPCGR